MEKNRCLSRRLHDHPHTPGESTVKSLRLILIAVLATAAQAADLTGTWLISFETDDGLLRVRLTLQASASQLSARMNIDRHVLEGSGVVQGDKFEVRLQHAVSPGSSGHSSRLRLRGKLDGDQLIGTWDDTTNHGEWTATRLE